MAFDHMGNLLLVDSGLHQILMLGPSDGKLKKVFGKHGKKQGEFHTPYGIAVDLEGQLIITDTNNHRIQASQTSVFIAPL